MFSVYMCLIQSLEKILCYLTFGIISNTPPTFISHFYITLYKQVIVSTNSIRIFKHVIFFFNMITVLLFYKMKSRIETDLIRSNSYGIIPILRQQNDCVSGSRKWPVLLTFITVFMLIRWVGGVQKGKKYADVIQGWSLF